jgi:basic membrane protein A
VANPDTMFAIVDFAYDPSIENVRGLTFATDEAAFLAGYLAAATSKTGKVGQFGGIEIPPVTIFMVGFENGVAYYNQQHGTEVEVLGTDVFVGNFESTDDGRRVAESLMDEGADIIMPVAGPVGLGTAAACQERGAMMIGVDTDWYISAPEYKEIYLTSVLKNMDVAVFETALAVQSGTFEGGTWVGTLKNDGVGLAPFHDFEDQVSAEVKAELETIKAGLVAGEIDTGWPVE